MEGGQWLHRVFYLHLPEGAEGDEASLQCRMVAEIAREFYLPLIAVETNGIGKFLPAILRRELAAAKISCAVLEKSSRRAKAQRILEAFDAVMAARALHVHGSVDDTPFIREMAEWRPGAAGQKDDGLDAAAGALSLEPMRLPRRYFTGSRRWTGAGEGHTAVTDFDI
jgi:hypothetical protein